MLIIRKVTYGVEQTAAMSVASRKKFDVNELELRSGNSGIDVKTEATGADELLPQLSHLQLLAAFYLIFSTYLSNLLLIPFVLP